MGCERPPRRKVPACDGCAPSTWTEGSYRGETCRSCRLPAVRDPRRARRRLRLLLRRHWLASSGRALEDRRESSLALAANQITRLRIRATRRLPLHRRSVLSCRRFSHAARPGSWTHRLDDLEYSARPVSMRVTAKPDANFAQSFAGDAWSRGPANASRFWRSYERMTYSPATFLVVGRSPSRAGFHAIRRGGGYRLLSRPTSGSPNRANARSTCSANPKVTLSCPRHTARPRMHNSA